MTDIINNAIFRPDGLEIPQDTDQGQWADIHRTILTCARASRRWLKTSRDFATERWGVDYVAEAEVQMELALGIECKTTERVELNPGDKSKGIVTIEGIVQQFTLWHRKMDKEIETWDRPKLEKALGLLAPIESEAKRIREKLQKF